MPIANRKNRKRKRAKSPCARDIALAIAVFMNLMCAVIQTPIANRSLVLKPTERTMRGVASKFRIWHTTLRKYIGWLKDDQVVKRFKVVGELVPFEELRDWVKSRQKRGPKRYLTEMQAQKVMIVLNEWQRKGQGQDGSPVTNELIADMMMVTAGKDKMPSRTALKAFTDRHPQIINKIVKNIDLARQRACNKRTLAKHWKVRYN